MEVFTRLQKFIISTSSEEQQLCPSYLKRMQYSMDLISILEDEDDSSRDLNSLRLLYVYKKAEEKNILQSGLYPLNHFENWLIVTVLAHTDSAILFHRYIATVKSFLEDDVIDADFFFLENLDRLDLKASPPCPLTSRIVEEVRVSRECFPSCTRFVKEGTSVTEVALPTMKKRRL